MYGEYGEDIPLAPYFIEPVLTNFGDEPSANVRSQLLSSAMKLFFKRAPEMQAMLGAALLASSALREAISAASDEASGDDALTRVTRLKSVINEHAGGTDVDEVALKEARALRDRLVEVAKAEKKTSEH